MKPFALAAFGFFGLTALSTLPGTAGAQSIDHFNVYSSSGQDGPVVTIADQFGTSVTDLGNPSLFLVPADKNGEGLIDPFSHLTCYDVLAPVAAPPEVISTNQFGSQTLALGDSLSLCVPTEKLIFPGPVSIDHFQCYEASGPPVDVAVAIQDQFQGQNALVLDPFLFCNPADKNGEGIQNPVDHLTCYSYLPPGAPIGPLPILNQFFPASTTIDVFEPFALCVPSLKELPPDPEPTPVPAMSMRGFGALVLAILGAAVIVHRSRSRHARSTAA